jgi:dTDP-4-dehydrorhamnose 3,5-epimerase
MSGKPYIINGGIHTDERGTLLHVNDFDFSGIKRFYQVENSSTQMVRAWQGHRIESKHFFVGQGAFLIAAVKIDDWENPSADLKAEHFVLKASAPQILYIPPGYANGVKALEEHSILTIFSNLSLEQSANDTYRFDASLWFKWKENPLTKQNM